MIQFKKYNYQFINKYKILYELVENYFSIYQIKENYDQFYLSINNVEEWICFIPINIFDLIHCFLIKYSFKDYIKYALHNENINIILATIFQDIDTINYNMRFNKNIYREIMNDALLRHIINEKLSLDCNSNFRFARMIIDNYIKEKIKGE